MTNIQVGTRVRVNDNYASRTDTAEYLFGVQLFGEKFAEEARLATRNVFIGREGTVVEVFDDAEDFWPYAVQIDGDPESLGRVSASAEELDVLEEANV